MAKDKKTHRFRFIVPDDGFPGFWAIQSFFPKGESEGEITPEARKGLLAERELHRGAFRMTMIDRDTGETFAPLPEEVKLSAEEKFEADKARAEEIEARKERVEAERRDRERLEAEARERDLRFAAELEERRRTRVAEVERVARVLAEEDERIAAQSKRAEEAARERGVVVHKVSP